MTVEETFIADLFILRPKVFQDDRGFFVETFNQALFEEKIGKKIQFVQDNLSSSKQYTLRGLHFQNPPSAQGKLVRVSAGSALDVAVDLRKTSSSFGQYFKILLSAENQTQFWVPEGFAHGFVALEAETVFEYKCTNYYSPENEQCILWNDSTLNIDWGDHSFLVSPKDAIGLKFDTFKTPF
jgi:dTDP-4-dehydrorhamnose 3,5-epimerase